MCEWMGIERGDEFNPILFDASEIEFEDPKNRLKEWEDDFGL